MSHSAEHVVVKIATPVEVASVRTRGGIVGAVLLVAGMIIGALIF